MHLCQHLYMDVSVHPQLSNVWYPLKLTETVYFDLCLFLQCIAVCISCAMRFVQWPYQMQMTRQGVEETEACSSLLSLLQCSRPASHISTSALHTWSPLARSCILPRLAAWPRTCLGSKSSKFLLASF